MTKNILVLDETGHLLPGLKQRLGDSAWQILSAGSLDQSLRILQDKEIDVLVDSGTAARVPERGDRLARLGADYPHLQVILADQPDNPLPERRGLISGFFKRDKARRDGLDRLVELIKEALDNGVRGDIQGVSLSGLLQLFALEKRSCTLQVSSGGRLGFLYCRAGRVYAAIYGRKRGTRAAFEILTWENPQITLSAAAVLPRDTINMSIPHLLLEAMRLCDEGRL